MDSNPDAHCTRLNLGNNTMSYATVHKDKMRIGMSLASNPDDESFVACGPLWSYECGSAYYTTGICSRIDSSFQVTNSIAPAFQPCETFMDIVIVLDGSNSIYPWYEVQDFLISVLQKFCVGLGQTQVGIVQYGTRVVHEFALDDYHSVDEVVEAAQNIQQRGGEETRTALGINSARSRAFKRGGREGAKKVMIVITDGESHDSIDLRQAVEDSERDNITLYAIAVLGYYNRRGINPEAFLNEIKFIATDPEEHFFTVTDESALKDIVDALGERIFSLEGTNKNETSFELQMSQAGFSSHIVEDGVLVGAVGAYDWNGAVLKQGAYGKVIPPKSSYSTEFPESLKNHASYLGYTVNSVKTASRGRLYVSGAPRFNHTGKVIIFTLQNNGNLTILHALSGQQIGSYFGSEMTPLDVTGDGVTDFLLVAAPMFFRGGLERGRVYVYRVTEETGFVPVGWLEGAELSQNSRFGFALATAGDLNGDGYTDLLVGAPLEDEHRGAVYLFHGRPTGLHPRHTQRIAALEVDPGLRYLGCSLDGRADVNTDGLADIAVGSLGAVVLLWSRSVVRVHLSVIFEPRKVNVFQKDCHHAGKDVTCMAAIVCVTVTAHTPLPPAHAVDLLRSVYVDEERFFPRAALDNTETPTSSISVMPNTAHCQRIPFHVQETSDYSPMVFRVEVALQDPHQGPLLDQDWPRSIRTELPFWNGCEEDERCIPNLILHAHTDLLDRRQFCEQRRCVGCVVCEEQLEEREQRIVEAARRRLFVDARLESHGEKAYGTTLKLSYSHNLAFRSLVIKDFADVHFDCYTVPDQLHQRVCNISSPFMKSKSQVFFRVEFELSRSFFLDYVQVTLEASSQGEEWSPEDNVIKLYHPLKYEADLLFTRDSTPPRYEIKPKASKIHPGVTGPTFNLSYQIRNLGLQAVEELQLTVELAAITSSGNQLLHITHFPTDQAGHTHTNTLSLTLSLSHSLTHTPIHTCSHCTPSRSIPPTRASPEDLLLTPQLNRSNSVALSVQCSMRVPPQTQISITIGGWLHLRALLAVHFRKLELLTSAYVELNPASHTFLQEARPTRHIILEIRKEVNYIYRIPIWIIIGSSLGGLLLLALLVLALWKVGCSLGGPFTGYSYSNISHVSRSV
ncbi:hypothetical protein ACEWY4_010742 [Coilia grayii]|uniref:VWFA domain-containing protein n=1 Tax=Coilia grayii TaxID=363190 RepID=A0ABD1K2S0_9TELE